MRYANCWRNWAEQGVSRAYSTIGREVGAYETSLRQATYGAIGAEAESATRLLASEQQSERAALERRYDEAARAIVQQATAQNRAETNQKRAELLATTRAETTALLDKHAAANAELREAIRLAYSHADEEIARRVADDREALAEQQRTKLRYIDRGFGSLAGAEPGQSLAQYEDEQWPDEEDDNSFFRALQGLFVFVSGLIGKQGPEDDPEPKPFGSLGIRG